MVLNIPGQMKEQLFKQSKNNDEGITERQKKTDVLTIPGREFHKNIETDGHFDLTDGVYLAIGTHDVGTSIRLPNNATLISIKAFGTSTDSWDLRELDGADIIGTGSIGGPLVKINKVIDNKYIYDFHVYLTNNKTIQRIEITYMI